MNEDLAHILSKTRSLWEELRGQHIFITGGTGFFGRWLLESFAHANEQLDLDAQAVVLSRDPESFKASAPHLALSSAIKFHLGDIKDFVFPTGQFSHIIHAAATFGDANDSEVFESIVQGTKRTLEFAGACGAKKFLLVSSGAVYGKQPSDISHIFEDFEIAPSSVYGEGKKIAESLCLEYTEKRHTEIKIARCFAFVGPFLPLDKHFAIGNFIRDGLSGGPIQVRGDGTAIRSYLYAADLAIWLWTILFEGRPRRIYNVGSENEIMIGELAQLVAKSFNRQVEIIIAKPKTANTEIDRFVPSTKRAREELQLTQTVSLKNAIQRTIDFYQKHQ